MSETLREEIQRWRDEAYQRESTAPRGDFQNVRHERLAYERALARLDEDVLAEVEGRVSLAPSGFLCLMADDGSYLTGYHSGLLPGAAVGDRVSIMTTMIQPLLRRKSHE